MTDRSPQNQDKFIVRLPDGMRDRIKAAADLNGRSMNAEIVAALSEKYPEPGQTFEVSIETIKALADLQRQEAQLVQNAAPAVRLAADFKHMKEVHRQFTEVLAALRRETGLDL